MNDLHHNDSPAEWDDRMDRLVDGELTPAEYRELLANLDDEPGGWRRCALAFLEAQALQREMESLRDEAVDGSASRPQDSIPPAKAVAGRSTPFVPMLLAMAASFLVAFALG